MNTHDRLSDFSRSLHLAICQRDFSILTEVDGLNWLARLHWRTVRGPRRKQKWFLAASLHPNNHRWMSNPSFDENKRRQNVQLMESNTLLRMSSCWLCCHPDTSFMTQGFRVKLDTVSKRAESELKQDETTSSCNLIQAPWKIKCQPHRFRMSKTFQFNLVFLEGIV